MERVCLPPLHRHPASRPISVAVYYTAEDKDLFNSYKSKFEGTSIHFSPYFSEDSSLFPINKLRNMAVEAVKTPYYMLIDIDMLPSCMMSADRLIRSSLGGLHHLHDHKGLPVGSPRHHHPVLRVPVHKEH